MSVIWIVLLAAAARGQDAGMESQVKALQDRIVELEQGQGQLNELRTQVRQLQAAQRQSWLARRRSQEVNALIQEVLADAEPRSTALEGSSTGHDGKRFYLASDNGAYRLNVAGHFQLRYIFNSRDEDRDTAAEIDDDEFGFQLRRAKVKFFGQVADPKIHYNLVLAADRRSNDVGLEDSTIAYQLLDQVKIEAGRRKLPFLREELTSSSRLLAVDRAIVTEFFTLNRGEGVWMHVHGDDQDWIKWTTAISDGANSGNIGGTNDFDQDRTDFAVTSRLDGKLAVDWNAMKDFSAWSNQERSIFVGGAIHYELGETDDDVASNNADYLAWTIDGSIECHGWNLFAAYMGGQVNNADSQADQEHHGVLVQSGYMLVPDRLEPFVRYEYIKLDETSVGNEDIDIVTAGFNWYMKRHAAKFTMDILYALDPLVSGSGLDNEPFGANGVSGGLGVRPDDGDESGQIALRAQIQLLF